MPEKFETDSSGTQVGTTAPYPRDHCLHQLFDAQARRTPDAPAAIHHGAVLSYAELRARSEAVASRLRRGGVRRGDPVGVCGGRSLEALVAFLGILRAGAAYVPLDDAVPPARLQAMCDDAGVQVAVVLPGSTNRVRTLRMRVDLGRRDEARDSHADPTPDEGGAATDRAYVMFTSGSTGRPKPVVIPHRGVVRLACADVGGSRPGTGDRVLHGYGLSSDSSTIEIWSALLNGACLVLVDREELLSPPALESRIREDGITVAYLTTSVFHHVARTRPTALSALRFVSAGGEEMDPRLAREVLAACPDTPVVNFYGPTENTVVSTGHVLRPFPDDATSVPIGKPILNSTCRVLRAVGSAAEAGEEGELFVGGDGLALGYLDAPELTARCFVDDPLCPGSTVYRTGDSAVLRADGALEYRGRVDRQLKIRGHRTEPAEIEARLREHPNIGEAVVEPDSAGERLLAFVTPSVAGRPVPVERARAELAQWLPAAVVPSRLVELDEFPITPAGKVDRARLTTTLRNREPQQTAVSGLRDGIAEIWYTTLRVHPAGADDFFALGGDSLTAAEVVNRTLSVFDMAAEHGTALIRGLLGDSTFDGYVRAVLRLRNGTETGRAVPDFAADSRLGFTLPPRRAQRLPNWSRPSQILLTGASGFVGAFLLARILNTTDAVVHCPVRSHDADQARRRITANLARYSLDPSDVDERVVCFPSDLSSPDLGLTEEHFERLSEELDLILHSGAQVNFVYPYRALHAPNVAATRSLVRLAAPRRVPVHFLSTIAVVAGFGTAGVRRVAEDVPLEHAERLTLGYAESKWVAERVLQEAAAQGLPIAIYRPYEITGERESGVCNTATAICSLLKTVAETGLAPDIPLPMDFVPVDHVAEAVLRVATRVPPTRRVYHLTNPRPARFTDMVERMRAAGFAIRTVLYDTWVGELVRYVAANPTSATAPFVSLCVDRGRHSDISVKEMFFEGTFPELGRENAGRDLADLPCPPVDESLLDRYLEYFFDSGYIERPEAAAPTSEAGRGPRVEPITSVL